MVKENKNSPFDYIKSISHTKKNIMEEPKEYQAFIVNRGLSYFPDTVLFANEVNRLWAIPPKYQYEYLLNSIRPKDRFSKWNKKDKEKEKTLTNIMEYYNCGYRVAKQYYNSIGEENVNYINNVMASRQ